MCSNPCESEVTCFRPESNRGPYGILDVTFALPVGGTVWCRQALAAGCFEALSALCAEKRALLSLSAFPINSRILRSVSCTISSFVHRSPPLASGNCRCSRALTWFILAVCGGNKNIDMSHLSYGMFQYFSSQNDMVYLIFFWGEGVHATKQIHTREKARENEQEAQASWRIFIFFNHWTKTCFARDSGYERTFLNLPKVIQVQWKLPKQKDFYVLIYGYFNQNRPSLLSNVWGGMGHKCRRLPTTRWRCRRK